MINSDIRHVRPPKIQQLFCIEPLSYLATSAVRLDRMNGSWRPTPQQDLQLTSALQLIQLHKAAYGPVIYNNLRECAAPAGPFHHSAPRLFIAVDCVLCEHHSFILKQSLCAHAITAMLRRINLHPGM